MAIAASTLICHRPESNYTLHRTITHAPPPRPAAPPLLQAFVHVHAISEREISTSTFHALENARMTPSNVPNTAMLTGTARTSVGTRPRQKTRPPDSAYILRAVRHDELTGRRPVSVRDPVIVPLACKRVLRTSKGNVAIQPITPAAAPATSGGTQTGQVQLRGPGRCESESGSPVSSRTESGWCCAGCTGVDAKRRSVPSYCFCCCYCMGFILGAWEGGSAAGPTHPVEV